MALKISVRDVPIAFFSLLALASLADAQSPSGSDTANTGAGAEKLTYGVDAGLGETDNVTLTSTNKVSQTMSTVDVDFDVKHQSRRLDVDAKGNFTDLDYLEGAFGNELIGRLDGTAHLALVPQRLTWVVQDDFGQAALDPFTPVTPGNIENINFVSTGPDMAMRVGGTGFVDASVRYARADYQTSPFSSSRGLGSVSVGDQLSSRSSVSLNGVAERVLFDNTAVNGDFNRTSAYFRFEIEGARTGLLVDLGATKLNQNASGPRFYLQSGTSVPVLLTFGQTASSTTGPLALISATRRLSSAATIRLSGGRELTDPSSSFSGIQGGAIGVAGTASAALTSSSYTSNFASAGWEYVRNRTTVAVSGRWEKDVYVSQPQFDLTRGGAEFKVSRQLSRAFALQVLGRYYKSDYIHGNLLPLLGAPKSDDALIGAALTWRHGRALELRLRGEHSSRITSPSGFGSQENRVFLTIGYRPRPETSSDIPDLLPSNDGPRA